MKSVHLLKKLERTITHRNVSERLFSRCAAMIIPEAIGLEYTHEPWHSKLLIGADSMHKAIWDFYILICLLFQAFWIPLSLSLDLVPSGILLIFDTMITATFFLDILLTMNTKITIQGVLITKRWEILKNYMKFWFWVDCLASFPYDWVFSGSFQDTAITTTPRILRLFKIFRFIRMLKLLRLARLKKIIFRIEDTLSSDMLYVVFIMTRMTVGIFFIAHWTACAFLYVSDNSADHFHTVSADMDTLNFEKYINFLYWATTTMITIGFGDISAQNEFEMIVTINAMTISCGYYTYVLGKITGFIFQKMEMGFEKKLKQKSLRRFLKRKNLPLWLYKKTQRYLCYVDDINRRNCESQSFMDNLSIPIKNSIFHYIFSDTLSNCLLIKKLFPSFLVNNLIRCLEEEVYMPGDEIITEGTYGRKIYFVKSGTVCVFHSKTLAMLQELGERKCVGEIGFFTGRRRTASVVCVNFTEFMTLDWFTARESIRKYPLILNYICLAQKQIYDGNFASIKVRCYFCHSKSHIATGCQLVLVDKNMKDTGKKWVASRKKSICLPVKVRGYGKRRTALLQNTCERSNYLRVR